MICALLLGNPHFQSRNFCKKPHPWCSWHLSQKTLPGPTLPSIPKDPPGQIFCPWHRGAPQQLFLGMGQVSAASATPAEPLAAGSQNVQRAGTGLGKTLG